MATPVWLKEAPEAPPTGRRLFNTCVLKGRPTLMITWGDRVYIKHYHGIERILLAIKAFEHAALSERFFKKYGFVFHSYTPDHQEEFIIGDKGGRRRAARYDR